MTRKTVIRHRSAGKMDVNHKPDASDATKSASEEDASLERATYASPPCLMHEVDPSYLGYLSGNEILSLLNELLEGERAGARVTGVLSRNIGHAEIANLLRDIRNDEARFCGMLTQQIERIGGAPSHKTGAFHEKVLALEKLSDQLALLNRGQGWVVRKLRESLPRISDDILRAALKDMLEVHEQNIERCAQLTI